MKLKDKELLLRDLSARLLNGIVCDCMHGKNVKATMVDVEDFTIYYTDCDEWESIEYCKPYLRPMSSMTEEEKVEYGDRCYFTLDCINKNQQYYFNELYDWLNRKMFDYRGLIPMGLALEAPEGMYNIANS